METAQALCERLREQGYSITPQRRTIFEVLEGTVEHPTAEQVHAEVRKRLPDVSLATVYKTLKELVAMGEILELNFHDDRSRFDPKTGDHSHLKCVQCGRLEDIDCNFDHLHLQPCDRHGYQVLRHEVIFYGNCPKCQRKK
jgi:Fe2+ or Zn2+ uptake regulation protein